MRIGAMHSTMTQTPDERALSAPPTRHVDAVNGGPPDHHPRQAQPRSLGEALREAGISLESSGPASETPSEEDYDENVRPAYAIGGQDQQHQHQQQQQQQLLQRRKTERRISKKELLSGQVDSTTVRDDSGRIRIYPANDKALQELLRRTSETAKHPDKAAKQKRKFRDHFFTHQFSAFDPHNSAAANSPFHGFYTLFWLAVALFVLKISVNNWRAYGTPLGSNEIMKTMFHRDVIVLLLSDGIMCGLTGVSWLIQKLVYHRVVDWDRSGWIVQNIWQTLFITGIIAWTHVRDWPWTHTVFFVLHGIVMLMKQHSYAFYNGHLSTVYLERLFLLSKLKQLDHVHPSEEPSSAVPQVSSLSTDHLRAPPTAMERRHSLSQIPKTEETDIDRIAKVIASREPLNDEQIAVFERIIKWEVDALADELRGTASDPNKAYPNNLTFLGHYEWIPLPTLVYELEYPRSQGISWKYVAEKLVAMVGVLFVMNQVAQYSIYPVVMKTVQMKENGLPLAARFREFPLLLLDLIFPFMMEYLLVWYLIWETILNVLAELTYFADRSFYDAWWNSVSWDQFARDWNRPVHVFLLRHVYHSSISSMKVNKHTATLITFFLSACIHELVMWCLFNKLRGYLLVLQMCQLPLVRLSRTTWLKGRKTLGNLIFWLGIFTGPSLLCSLYLIL
ncbi:Sterol O-acyltransferase 2 (Sterol-ester synthase 2) [Metarhizium acridum]|uniref:Sterol O-acyltransferase 2 (Sterol-ester synthase 2) n=1 Tax=Metarhizium acridum TaxID=92637 RepID=UPI001C6B601D|nr:Sterol O-acyltransferase 2 (Sterol-ester synthase 2) [Metarhizium acridum]